MRFATLWAVALGFACASARAQGQGAERFRLRWSAVASCPSQQDVQAEAERLLGASKLPTAAPALDVDAQVTGTSRGFDLQLTLGQGAEARVRSLTAPTCMELGHATALVVALAIDPSLQPGSHGQLTGAADVDGATATVQSPCPETNAFEQPHVPQIPALTPPPPPCPRCPSTPSPRLPEEGARTSHYALLAGTSLAYGALPQALPRVSLGAGYRSGTHSLELSAEGAFASSGPRVDGSGATFLLGLASPRYCERARVGSIALGACGVFEVGAVSATGFGVIRPNTRHPYWIAAGVGIQGSLPLAADAELRISGDLLVVATRTRFELDYALFFRPNLIVPAARLTVATGLL